MDPTAPEPPGTAVSLLMPQTSPATSPREAGRPTPASPRRIDPVSVADVLRNGFVCPPHSIFEGVDMEALSASLAGRDPEAAYRFRYRDSGKHHDASATPTPDWVDAYHRHLCDAISASC